MGDTSDKRPRREPQAARSEAPAAAPDAPGMPVRKRVITELEQRLQRLRAVDSELAGGCGDHRRMELRLMKADLLAEIEALEVAIRYARPD